MHDHADLTNRCPAIPATAGDVFAPQMTVFNRNGELSNGRWARILSIAGPCIPEVVQERPS